MPAQSAELYELCRTTGISMNTLRAFHGPRFWGVVAGKLLSRRCRGAAKHAAQFQLPISELDHVEIGSFTPGDDRLASILDGYRQGAPVPPIKVYRHHAKWHVIDGHHRLTAARQLQLESIWSVGIDLDRALACARARLG